MPVKLELIHQTLFLFKRLIACLIPVILLASCDKSTKQEGADTSLIKTDSTPSGNHFYVHLIGTIGKRAVSMDLLRENGPDGKAIFNGCYSFDSDQTPIPIFSIGSDSLDRIELSEAEVPEGNEGKFYGKFQSGKFVGQYTSPNGTKQDFSLQIAFPEGSISFDPISGDSTIRASDSSETPFARFSYNFLCPKEPWLLNAMLGEVHGDSLARLCRDKPSLAFKKAGNQFAMDYQTEVQSMIRNSELESFLNYELAFGVEVLYNRSNLLSLSFSQYSYTGGAHGILFSKCASFDLNAKKQIKLEDVIKANSEEKLKIALTAAAKKKYKTNNLTDVLLVNEIIPNENFFLSGKGICFNFQPYEIGPFSMGEQKIYLPFSSIQDIVR
jgi:hypothetical protein